MVSWINDLKGIPDGKHPSGVFSCPISPVTVSIQLTSCESGAGAVFRSNSPLVTKDALVSSYKPSLSEVQSRANPLNPPLPGPIFPSTYPNRPENNVGPLAFEFQPKGLFHHRSGRVNLVHKGDPHAKPPDNSSVMVSRQPRHRQCGTDPGSDVAVPSQHPKTPYFETFAGIESHPRSLGRYACADPETEICALAAAVSLRRGHVLAKPRALSQIIALVLFGAVWFWRYCGGAIFCPPFDDGFLISEVI